MDAGLWMVLVICRCCLFNGFVLFLCDNVIRSVLIFIKVFSVFFPFLLCWQAQGRRIFNVMLCCYRFYKWHVFVPHN